MLITFNMDIITNYTQEFLLSIGVAPNELKWWSLAVYIAMLTVLSIITYVIVHQIVVIGVRRVVSRTTVKWDDDLFNDKLLSAVCHIVPPVLLLVITPWALKDYTTLLSSIEKGLMIYITVVSVRLINILLSSIHIASRHAESLKGHPLKGLIQMLKLIAICVGLIIIISLLIDKNPIIILSGLGASAAILMLVFKDTIMGLVAGVQLSVNDMLKPGDWIEAPKHGVNGTVEDVTLTTVKVRNWDMTIVTVPPYSLVSDSFQNWRGMQMSGGRRVKRSINIDVNTVKTLSETELAQYTNKEWYKNFNHNGEVVNLHLFRHYINWYLDTHPQVNHEMLSMVRQLQPENHGIPIELYFFTATTAWVEYEDIQAQIFEHIFANIGNFGLRLFQSPSGLDFSSLQKK